MEWDHRSQHQNEPPTETMTKPSRCCMPRSCSIEQPRQSCACAKWWRFTPRLRLGKLTEEALCLGRPTTSNLTSQHDKPARGDQSTQDLPTLFVGGHAATVHPQLGCAVAVCRPASVAKRVWCPKRVALQWKSVSNFQATSVHQVLWHKVHSPSRSS